MTNASKSNAIKRAERYAAMLPTGARYEIQEHDYCVQLTVRNSFEYLIVTINDSRGTRTRASAVWAIFGRKTHKLTLRHLPTRLCAWFV